MTKYILQHKTSTRRRRFIALLAITTGLVVVAVAALAWRGLLERSTTAPSSVHATPKTGPLAYKSVAGKYLFSGTIVLDRVVVSAANGDVNQPFSQMGTFGQYDAGIADLECPVTDAPNLFMINVDNPHFNCRPDWLPALKAHYQIVKLSGNHTFDAGAAGFDATVKNLQAAGLQAVGYYNPHTDPKHNCEIVALPVRLQKTNGTENTGVLPVAFCAFNYKLLFATPGPGELEQITEYAKVMPVFGFLQIGTEYITNASQATKDMTHKLIDAGAQFVIANGTHYIGDSEAYKGKLITFSMGNFIFDQNEPESRRSVSIATNMSIPYDQNVGKWLALSNTCDISVRADDCLAAAKQQGLKNFDVQLTYKPLAGVGGARAVTHLSSEAEQKSVLERLDWAKTCSGLVGNVCAQ